MTVNILGTEYTIEIKKYADEEAFGRNSIDGYCDSFEKKIVICDLYTWDRWKHESKETLRKCMQETLRHEIVHAFFNESGLKESSNGCESGWAKNEEMVDWIALQLPKIYKACESVNAL